MGTPCVYPANTAFVINVINTVMFVNVLRITTELSWRWFQQGKGSSSLFRFYALIPVTVILLLVPIISNLVHPTEMLGKAAAMAYLLGVMVFVTNTAANAYTKLMLAETVGLVNALDPMNAAKWNKWLDRYYWFLVLFIGGGLLCSGVFIVGNSTPASRLFGARLHVACWVTGCLLSLVSLMYVRWQASSLQKSLKGRQKQVFKVDDWMSKVQLITIALMLTPFLFWLISDAALKRSGVVWLLAISPLQWFGKTIVGSKRLKMARESDKAKKNRIQPILVRDRCTVESVVTRGRTVYQPDNERSESGGTLGVSLQFLEIFSAENNIPKDATTSSVCAQFVKCHTIWNSSTSLRSESSSSASTTNDISGADSVSTMPAADKMAAPFAALMHVGGAKQQWTGVSTHFVSYTWLYTFSLLLTMLRSFEADNPPPAGTEYYYFIDQFSLNQHSFTDNCTQSSKQAQQALVCKLKDNIQRPGKVLMCLSPWDNPAPLARAWCVYELYLAITLGCEVHMCFSPEGAQNFYDALTTGRDGSGRLFELDHLIQSVDVEAAHASVATDKQMILVEIKETIGIETLNSQVRKYLESALKAVASSFLLDTIHANKGDKNKKHTARRSSFEIRSPLTENASAAANPELKVSEMPSSATEVTTTARLMLYNSNAVLT